MYDLAAILICILAGCLLRLTGKFKSHSSKALTTFVIYVSLPALVIHHVPATLSEYGLSSKLIIPVSMPWLQIFAAFIFFRILGKIFSWKPSTVGALVLTAGFANTSLVGFPVIEALLGPEAIKIGIIVSQAGSFLALSTVGLVLASTFSEQNASLKNICLGLFQYPPFLALLFSLGLYFGNIDLPEPVDVVIMKLAAALVPVALVAVGIQIRFDFKLLNEFRAPLVAGLFFKLILAPIVFGLLYIALLRDHGWETEIVILESAMAPMITGAIVAAQFDLDEKLAFLLVGIGIPISLLTVPGWFILAKGLFE